MRAMVLEQIGHPLQLLELPNPSPGADEVLIEVSACGVCRTDLHVVDGELPHPKLPLIPGHQIVGRVVAIGQNADPELMGQRVGLPWLGSSCGRCSWCRQGNENLCDEARYTGYQVDGGFAEYCVGKANFCFSLPEAYSDLQASPLLCAGLIGYRAYRKAGDERNLGFYGFGAAAHLLTQLAVYEGKKVFAFTRPNDLEGQAFAKKIGAIWAGGSDEKPPEPLDTAIIFAPSGPLVPLALQAIKKGGRVICAGIHMSDIPSFPYRFLWEERSIASVANLTRQDGREFLTLASKFPILSSVITYPLEQANRALADLREGRIKGAAVLTL